MRGIIPGCGEGLCTSETGNTEGMDAGFGAAGDHDVGGGVSADKIEGIADGVSARGAGGGGGVVGAAEGVAHRDVTGCKVDEEAGDEEGRDFFGALGLSIRG